MFLNFFAPGMCFDPSMKRDCRDRGSGFRLKRGGGIKAEEQ
jgi:hypothetical protein